MEQSNFDAQFDVEAAPREILAKFRSAREQWADLWLYGAGSRANKLIRWLGESGVEIAGLVVDDARWKAGTEVMGYEVCPITEVVGRYEREHSKIMLVTAFDGANIDKWRESPYVDAWNLDAVVLTQYLDNKSSYVDGRDAWTEYYNQHKESFEALRERLADDESRRHLDGFVRQKITGNPAYLEHVWVKNQYLVNDVVDFTRIHAMVDCGAFDGDSFMAFCKAYESNVGKPYDGKAYLMEPDSGNYEKLCRNCSDMPNAVPLRKGVWNEGGYLYFGGNGTTAHVSNVRSGGGSGVSDEQDYLPVDTIDNVTGCNADYIKMDIEGSELAALHGAEETIRRCHPILAICVYHRKEDMVEIPRYILSLWPEYKLHIRAHKPITEETVLYAVP